MVLYHCLHVAVAVTILKGVCGLALEKSRLSVRVAESVLLLGRLLEEEGCLEKDTGGPGPWGLWEGKEEMSPKAGGGDHLLGPRKCPGAMFQMGGLGRYRFIVNIHPARGSGGVVAVVGVEKWRRLLPVFNQIYCRRSVREVLLLTMRAYRRFQWKKTCLLLKASWKNVWRVQLHLS